MSSLLHASQGSFTLHMQQRGIKLNEAESRHDWDALLYHFYVQKDEATAPGVLLEKCIHFPRNPTADLEDLKTLADTHEKRLNNNVAILSEAFTAANRKHPLTPIAHRARVAQDQANKFYNDFTDVLRDGEKLKYLMDMRSRKEPRDGICDALLIGAIDAPSELIANTPFIISSAPAPLKKANNPDLVPLEKPLNRASYKEFLQDPFRVCSTASVTALPTAEPLYAFAGKLILPHFVAEYKKPAHDQGKALNQGRMYLVSVVSFYSALGIDDYPFYCLVTSGKVGAILVAWKSTVAKRTYIIDRNAISFDISIPVQAFQFASFLLRLRDDQEVLKGLARKAISRGVDHKRLREWTKYAQMHETPKDPDPEPVEDLGRD
ncbi:hypothetical protein C8R43DRAFT_948208 [Mycena crocata]|nr:hypothetical protein C8R43DRAFT_948208 [Mycena crocata]